MVEGESGTSRVINPEDFQSALNAWSANAWASHRPSRKALSEAVEAAVDTHMMWVKGRIKKVWDDMPEGWTSLTQEGYIMGYKQAIQDVLAVIDGEVSG
jgi:hypothetical protein